MKRGMKEEEGAELVGCLIAPSMVDCLLPRREEESNAGKLGGRKEIKSGVFGQVGAGV